MLINLSNHPSATWDAQQIKAARIYSEILDIPFPDIDPEWSEQEVSKLAEKYFLEINELISGHSDNVVVHLMGEYVFCHILSNMLNENGIETIASTSKRVSVLNADGSKTIQFRFVRFRKYI